MRGSLKRSKLEVEKAKTPPVPLWDFLDLTSPSMSDPSSLFVIQDIPNAGRGVVASLPISKDALVLRTSAPAVDVIFWQYRKEVCTNCFHYDRGRTLPVREN